MRQRRSYKHIAAGRCLTPKSRKELSPSEEELFSVFLFFRSCQPRPLILIDRNMSYAIDLKQVCGGYAYFSVFTHGTTHKSPRFEWREPSIVNDTRFETALADLNLKCMTIDSSNSYQYWLGVHGWALLNVDFARSRMAQWLKKHECTRSALGSYTDTSIASPSVLKRTLRGRSRSEILRRDGQRCILCGATENLTLQHILPYSLGGETHSSNLAVLCELHNQELNDEYHIELYELCGLRSGVEPTILKRSNLSDLALRRAVQLSSNLMHTRCVVW